METTTLQAEVREKRGKGPARRLRMEGKIPAVYYGPGVEPTPLTLAPKPIERALRGERGRNTVFTLELNGEQSLTMVRDLSVDPVTRELLHVDLYRVKADRAIDVMVPFVTQGRAIGVVAGGILNVTRRSLPLRTTPDKIPSVIEVDVTELELHDTISVKDIPLEDGVECALHPELTLVIVGEDRRQAEEEPTAAAEGEEGAEGEGAEGAPAAEGDATAAPAADGAGGDDKKD